MLCDMGGCLRCGGWLGGAHLGLNVVRGGLAGALLAVDFNWLGGLLFIGSLGLLGGRYEMCGRRCGSGMMGGGGVVHGNWVVRRHVVRGGSRGRRLASTEL